jgi:thiamine biosynthesis protein ThiI
MTIVIHDLIIIRYGEIALKSEETRNRFENCLIKNISHALKLNNILGTIKKERGRIYLFTEKIDQCISILKRIFGIVSFSSAYLSDINIKSISSISIDISKNFLGKEKTFALRVNRTGNHPFTSQDVAIKIGNDMVNATGAKVDLNKPDFEIFIEIRNKNSYIFLEKIQGLGGMPVGSQGNVLALIKNMYSLLAAWYILHRGCNVFFTCKDKTILDMINSFSTNWFIDSDITYIDSSNEDYLNYLKKITIDKKCDAIVTGNSLQNSNKNVLFEIKSLKEKNDVPILHPLISMSRLKIIQKCNELGISP